MSFRARTLQLRRTAIVLSSMACACSSPKTQAPAALVTWTPQATPPPTSTKEIANASVETRALSLTEALQLAGEQALDVKSARERVLVTRAEADIARAQFLPSLQLGAGFLEQHGLAQSTAGQFLNVNKRNTSLGGALHLRFEPGRVLFQFREAKRLNDASEHSLQARELESVRVAAHLYFDLVESYARLSIVETAQRQAQELVSFEESRSAVGAGLAVDLQRARAHLSATRGAGIEATAQRDLASVLLAEFLDLNTLQALRPTDSARIQNLVQSEDPDVLVERTADGHPRVSEQGSMLSAAEEREKQARYGWMIPTVDLGARFASFGPDAGNLKDQQIYTAALSWDLSPDIPARKRRARAKLREARLDQRRVRQNVRSVIVRATIAAETARQAIEAARDRQQAADEAFQLTQDRHRAGSSLLVEVLDAELAKLGAELALVTSISAFNRAQYDLLYAVGGSDPMESGALEDAAPGE